MQFRLPTAVVTALAAAASLAQIVDAVQVAEGKDWAAPAVKPKLVVPGDWMTDKAGKFMFLPMTIPESISLQQCKVLCNGDNLLVVVTEQPQDEPEDDALRKYKLVLDALKAEVGHDEKKLKVKLSEWLDTEEDEEVRVRVQAALDSLSDVQEAKSYSAPRTLKVPLGLPKSLLQLRGSVTNVTLAHKVSQGLPASAAVRTLVAQGGRGKHVRVHDSTVAATGASGTASHAASIIKESFTIDIPYPVPIPRVFAVLQSPGVLVVGMPWMKRTLAAKGVSTGGKPFTRVPVFDMKGKLLAGPKASSLSQLTPNLDMQALARQSFEPVNV
eukprot:CAMPEP_0176059450 /NCGR_PEP_ID=MMETSP0120_2-20121206/29627_1 /TAXON_ID=160619 /ORGANISM="Kryptoperidinium foliaceum, Strain CCMP 1326" /LENGTH=327 /DNA_ID=CAMNT_0017392987 /DNA_START=62 /DNA_END=1045 /DNA_ORIENTATION=+